MRGTLGDAFARGAIPPGTTLEQIQVGTSGIRLGELAPFFEDFDVSKLLEGLAASNNTLADLPSLDDMTLGDIATARAALANVLLDALEGALDGLTFDDVAKAIIDPATGRPVPDGSVLNDIRQAVSVRGSLDQLLFLGDLNVGDLVDAGRELTLGEIEPVLGFVTVKALEDALGIKVDLGTQTLGQLTAEELAHMTLNDLAALAGATSLGDLLTQLDLAGALTGFTLGDLLLALVDPASLSYGGVEFAQVDVSALPEGTVQPATFSAEFTMTAGAPRQIELEVALPTSASFVPGSATVQGVPTDPDVNGRTLTWTVPADPGVSYDVEFDVLPSLRLGATSINASARIVGTSVVVPAVAQLTVAEGLEPNDFLPEVVDAQEDFVYLTYISSSVDYDVFGIDVEENDVLVAELSNLDADLDLVLWGEAGAGSSAAALGNVSPDAPIIPVTDPDATGTDGESGNDFPRLDEIVAGSGLGGLPELALVATSNGPGTANEFLKSERLAKGRYYIQVYGANGAITADPAALQLKVIEADPNPVCRDIVFKPGSEDAEFGTVPTQAQLAAANTLLLLNESRLERLYGPTGRAMVVQAANALVTYLLDNPSLGVVPALVSVDAYQSVRDAYAAFDADGCVPAKANAVVAEINRTIIDPLRDKADPTLPDLEHIAILGGDDLIPMARLEDATTIANEYDYRSEFDGDVVTGVDAAGQQILAAGRNALTAAAWDSMILSDEPYGDEAARSLGDRYLYVTDVALGRVVETPQEIADALATFSEFGGQLDIQTATVLGYDFLSDGSALIADELEASELGTTNVDRELAEGFTVDGRAWDKDDATLKLVTAGTRALVSLNAHFDHYRALPALGDKVPNFNDNLVATAVETALDPAGLDNRPLTQSLIFSMGCHSGLSVSDIMIGQTNQDWAQTLGRQGSLFIGNTGFGYGDTEIVAYTEQLMALFADQVTSPFDLDGGTTTRSSTVGQALAWAKNAYVSELQTFSVYDEKAVMEATFYGLPFYRVGGAIAVDQLPPVPTNMTTPDSAASNQPALAVTAGTAVINEPVSAGSAGTYYRNVDADGNEQVIVAPGRPIQPKTSTDITVVDLSDSTKLGEVAHGAVVLEMTSTYVDLPNPVIATPVFDEGGNQPEPEIGSGVFPLKPLEIVTTTGPAGTRQTLVQATGQYQGEARVQRLDDDIAVTVYYADPSETDFTPPSIGAVTSSVAGGNLRVSLKAGSDLSPELVERVVLLVAQNPFVGATINWDPVDLVRGSGNTWTGVFDLRMDTSVVEFQVQAVDQAGNVGFASNKTGGFPGTTAPDPAITDVVAPAGPQAIDAGIQVTAQFTDPTGEFDTYRASFDWGDGTSSGGTVTPPTFASPGTATGNHVYAQPGRYDVEVTVTDRAGVASTSMLEAVVYEPGAAPVTGAIEGPSDVEGIGQTIDLVATFSDRSAGSSEDNYNATVDWGDGTTTDAIVASPSFFPELGTASASHVYGGVGTFVVTVTVSDGTTAVSTTQTIVVNDPLAPPVIATAPSISLLDVVGAELTVIAEFTDQSAPTDSYTATVDWGDGSPLDETGSVEEPTGPLATGKVTATKSYGLPGNYVVTVTVVDGADNPVSASTAPVRIYDPVAPPVIGPITAPTGPQPIADGVTVSAEFIDESMPNDGPFTASIDWGDGTTPDIGLVTTPAADGTGGVVSGPAHFYSKQGTYTVTISLTDGTPQTVTKTVDIEVVAPAGVPIVSEVLAPTAPTSNAAPIEVTASFTDASAPYEDYTAVIDWGDGTTSDGTVVAPDAVGGAGSVTGSLEYADAGIYTVTVTVTDQNGNSGELTAQLAVFDPDDSPFVLLPTATPSAPRVGEPVTVTAEYTDGPVPNGPFTATIDWGDGQEPVEILGEDLTQATPGSPGSLTATTTFDLPGTKQVVVIVTDGDGNDTQAMVGVVISQPVGVAIAGEIEGPTTPQLITDGVTIAATFDGGDPGAGYQATVAWGDGTTTSSVDSPTSTLEYVEVVPPTGDVDGTINAGHVYAAPGVYEISVTVANGSGAPATKSYRFVVVYDPTAGSVSGSGFFWSGPEARPDGPRWGTAAFFGYNARYKGDATVPTGKTKLRLLGDFYFRSTSYDYLIINDAMAIAEGVGNIGSTEYRFRVQGIDHGRTDFFQISIWDPNAPEGTPPIYDNGVLVDSLNQGDRVLLGGIRVKPR